MQSSLCTVISKNPSSCGVGLVKPRWVSYCVCGGERPVVLALKCNNICQDMQTKALLFPFLFQPARTWRKLPTSWLPTGYYFTIDPYLTEGLIWRCATGDPMGIGQPASNWGLLGLVQKEQEPFLLLAAGQSQLQNWPCKQDRWDAQELYCFYGELDSCESLKKNKQKGRFETNVYIFTCLVSRCQRVFTEPGAVQIGNKYGGYPKEGSSRV